MIQNISTIFYLTNIVYVFVIKNNSAWSGKPCAAVSRSPGAQGAFGANHHLRQCLVFLNMPAMQQPEAYIGGVDKLVDEQGGFTNPATAEFCRGVMAGFERWIRTVRGSP